MIEEKATASEDTPNEDVDNDVDNPVDQDKPDEGEDEQDTKPDTEEDQPDDNVNPDDYEPETREEIKEKEETPDEEDDDVDPDDAKAISRVVDKKLSPLEQKLRSQNDEIEVNSYIVDNPEYAKYKPVILKYMKSPSYNNIPVQNIAAIVSASDMQKIGAKKERDAAKKASDTRSTGSKSRKSSGGKTNWLTASKEDYEAKLLEVKSSRR